MLLRICSVGTWLSSSNVGDNAVFTGIRDLVPAAEFTVFTANPQRVREVFGVRALAPRRNPLAMLKSIARSDGLFFTGGTPFFDDPLHMAYYAGLAAFAKIMGKRVIVFGVSIRKLNKPALYFVRSILERADYIGAREKKTYHEFVHLARHKDRVKFFPDPAISMRPETEATLDNLLREEGVDLDKPLLGICLRNFRAGEKFQKHHYSKRFSDNILQNYIGSVRDFIELVVTESGYQVVFLPMHVHPPDDDRVAADEVYEGISDASVKERIFRINHQLSPRQMKGVLGRMSVVIGVRFHSLILSTSMQTPVINIGYARKNEEVMKLVGLEHFSTTLEHVSCELLKSRFAEIQQNRDEISRQLQHTYERLQGQTAKELDEILRVLGREA